MDVRCSKAALPCWWRRALVENRVKLGSNRLQNNCRSKSNEQSHGIQMHWGLLTVLKNLSYLPPSHILLKNCQMKQHPCHHLQKLKKKILIFISQLYKFFLLSWDFSCFFLLTDISKAKSLHGGSYPIAVVHMSRHSGLTNSHLHMWASRKALVSDFKPAIHLAHKYI